jgi:hypothetical protein
MAVAWVLEIALLAIQLARAKLAASSVLYTALLTTGVNYRFLGEGFTDGSTLVELAWYVHCHLH